MKIILSGVTAGDAIIATRAALWLIGQPETQKDAILVYGEKPNEIDIYVRRNKSSITARRCRKEPAHD